MVEQSLFGSLFFENMTDFQVWQTISGDGCTSIPCKRFSRDRTTKVHDPQVWLLANFPFKLRQLRLFYLLVVYQACVFCCRTHVSIIPVLGTCIVQGQQLPRASQTDQNTHGLCQLCQTSPITCCPWVVYKAHVALINASLASYRDYVTAH